MKIEKYIQQKSIILSTNFEANYKAISKILNVSSFFGNVASIFFAYSFLNKLLLNTCENFMFKSVLFTGITVLILIGFESVKRLLFTQTTVNYLKPANRFEKIAMLVLSIVIISVSSWLSITGAKELSNKTSIIIVKSDNLIQVKTDSLNSHYNKEIDKLQVLNDKYFNFIQTGTHSVKLRTQYNALIESNNTAIQQYKNDLNNALNSLKTGIADKTNTQVTENNKTVFAFLLISFFIESLILVGVWFKAYYDYKSFIEFDAKVKQSNKLKRFFNYYQMLDVLFNNGNVKPGQIAVQKNKFVNLIKIHDIPVSSDGINDFYTLLRHLNIISNIEDKPTKKLIATDLKTDQLNLKNYYNFK